MSSGPVSVSPPPSDDVPSAAAPAADAKGLIGGYSLSPGRFDELLEAPGRVRGHWEYVVRALESLGARELGRRGEEARRILRENGVTYNIYSDPAGAERDWAFDPIPLLFPSRDWVAIEGGLNQRAELLDLILADVYGSNNLIRRRLLPPEVIHSHPGFVRACSGMYQGQGRQLQLLASDLVRNADGRICVLGDRAQAPSGAGYALENRIVLSRTMPSLYRDAQVHRLAPFFRTLRFTLSALAPADRENPRVVLLTPGPGNETFFEHAYLANYLGFTLVQGSDLTVRDRRVWLKTLEGLQPVHVILRRMDDVYCDPLELRGDSLLGTPGLVEAARAGYVAIVNPLGSGILETPALLAFLPRLCKELLGEELLVPSASTWWCGDAAGRSHVLANLDRLVVKPTTPHAGLQTVFGERTTAAQRAELAARIEARPHLFVGQEPLPLSTAPVLRGERLEARSMVLRCFLVARGDSYMVMPGGLTRVAPTVDSNMVSNQFGGVSKDTWVLASEPERAVTLLPPEERPVALSRAGGEVPGRLADNLFWLGRYAERTDGSARLLRQLTERLLDSEADRQDASLAALLEMVAHQIEVEAPEGASGAPAESPLLPEGRLVELVVNPNRVGSLAFSIESLVGAGRSARDRLSDDTWRVITSLADELRPGVSLSALLESTERILTMLSAFAGLCAESMSRTQGWRFLDMGRRLERAVYTLKLLEVFCVPVREQPWRVLEVLLEITDSVMTYRRRYSGRMQVGAVLDLLLNDEGNPRSVGFQLVRLQDHVAALANKLAPLKRSSEERLLLEAVTALRLTDMEGLAAPQDARLELRSLLVRLENLLLSLSDAIGQSYFDHVDVPQQLVEFQ